MLALIGFGASNLPVAARAPVAVTIAGVPAVKEWYSLSCEYAATAAVTLYWGRLVSQSVFLREVPLNPNPHLGFRGDINGPWGGIRDYGVYAEALVPVLERRGYRVDVFYGPADRLKAEVAAGHPVVVWITGRRGAQPWVAETVAGQRFSLTPYEHTVVVYGYDRDGVWVMDVGNGRRYYYIWAHFLSRWAYFDQMALTMWPAW